MKTYVDFKLEKNLSSELLKMDKTYDFVMKPLKNDPLETTVSLSFFLEIEIFTTKIVNSKSLRKICRQLLSTMNVLKNKNEVMTTAIHLFSQFYEQLKIEKDL